MVAKFDQTDGSVVVIIGTGAGGGVLANELAQKGVKVVALEAGGRYLPEDYVNDEWESFGQLAWLDPRTTSGDWRVAKDFSGLPAWIVKAVGGTTTHWAGASLRFQDHEWKALTTYGRVDGANLLDWPIDGAEMAPWYDKAETKLGVTRTGDRPGLLRDVSEVFARDRLNVTAVNTQSRAHVAHMQFTIEVPDAAVLARTLAAVREVSGVFEASRR